MADEKNTSTAPHVTTAKAVYGQLVAAGAATETAEATQWLLERILGIQPVRFDPEGADALAAELGTPNAARLRAAAEELAADFEIVQVNDLCALLQQGIIMSCALRSKLMPATINGQPGLILPFVFDREKELIEDLALVLERLRNLPIARDPCATDNLIEVIEKYCDAYRQQVKEERRPKPPHQSYGLVAILALHWSSLTGEELHKNYSSKASKGGRGRFYEFAKAACKAVGIEVPSDRTIERCLEDEGLRR